MDPHGRILVFLDRGRYCFFQVSPQLYSRGRVDPVPDPLLLRKSGSAGNRTRDLCIFSQGLWTLDYRGGPQKSIYVIVKTRFTGREVCLYCDMIIVFILWHWWDAGCNCLNTHRSRMLGLYAERNGTWAEVLYVSTFIKRKLNLETETYICIYISYREF
jgi:hypothetical protein